MENWQSWLVPSAVVPIGILVKFLLEIYLPENGEGIRRIKQIVINTSMTLFFLYILGNTAYRLLNEPWSEHLMLFVLFQAFLFIGLVAFLVIMRVFKIFFKDFTEDIDQGEQRLQSLGNSMFIKN
ncbi:MAG: ABC-type multidrug transport system fused ATPase/permease subunit [Cryomorphaceae bacterium]|jgi:ABC-type multidrug transport system fused ATPase/permease subunit